MGIGMRQISQKAAAGRTGQFILFDFPVFVPVVFKEKNRDQKKEKCAKEE
jgi:hypothetical protein